MLYNDPAVRYNDPRLSYNGDELPLVPVLFTVPTPTIDTVLAGSHRPLSLLEFLSADLLTVEDTLTGFLLDGGVETDRSSPTYSSGSVRVLDVNGNLVSVESLAWPNRVARLSRGAYVNDAALLYPLITGVVAEPQDGAYTAEVGFRVASRFSIAQRQFSAPLTVTEGMRGWEAIRTLAELGGLGTSDLLYDLDDGGYVVTVSRTFGTNEEILGAMVKFAFDMGCDLWPRGDGVTTMRPFVDPATESIARDFGGDTLLSLTRQVTARQAYNRQRVIGRGPDGYEVVGEAKITNPLHPLAWSASLDLPARDYISPDVSSVEVANTVAERLLRDLASYDEAYTAEAIPDPRRAARDIVSFSGAAHGEASLLDRVTMPLYHGAMSMQARRTRSLGIV